MEIIELQLNEDIKNNRKVEGMLSYPVVYILNNDKKVYIGETTNVLRRLDDHKKNPERKNLTKKKLIIDEKFNQSATYNIETNLINYFIGDEKYIIQNKSQIKQKIMHNYYNKSYYDEDLFEDIWNKLYEMKFVNNTVENIKNKDIFKLSPFKSLSDKQSQLKNEIIYFCKQNIKAKNKKVFTIDGEAGTGKSVLISALYNEIQDLSKDKGSDLYKTNNYILVNHGEMLKSYHKLTRSLSNLKKKQIMKPTSFINSVKETADVVIIDEAHLLLSSPDKFNGFNEKNQLAEIIKKSKIVILIFDKKQYLKVESYWDEKELYKTINDLGVNVEKHRLTKQLRMGANLDTINWIDSFVSKKIKKIPKDNNFELKCFRSAKEMHQEIIKKNKKFGLSRVVSTFDFIHKKTDKGEKYYVETEDFKLPWNSTFKDSVWAEENTVNEVGSIYSIQGFDLNYVGVILGPSISYNEKEDRLDINIEKYKDIKAMMVPKNKKDLKNITKIKEQIILNSINVLLKRGVKGLYIYAYDKKLREKLKSVEQLK